MPGLGLTLLGDPVNRYTEPMLTLADSQAAWFGPAPIVVRQPWAGPAPPGL